MKNLETIELLKIKIRLLIIVGFLLSSCSEYKDVKGATWSGSSDFMEISSDKMKMHYGTSIPSNKVFIGGLFEVLQAGNNKHLTKLKVTEIEFEERMDGLKYCRIWGSIEDSDIPSYFLANNCEPFYN